MLSLVMWRVSRAVGSACCMCVPAICGCAHRICSLLIQVDGFMPITLEPPIVASHVGAQLLIPSEGCVGTQGYLLLDMRLQESLHVS